MARTTIRTSCRWSDPLTVHVVTDSTSDLAPDEALRLGVRVVPLQLRFGEESFRDGVDIDAATFYRRLPDADPMPVTSQPSPNDFAEVYRALLASPDDRVLSIHISSKWSGTLQSASLAAQEFGDRVRCIDSLTISAGMQFLVRGALADAAAGADLETCATRAEERRGRVSVWVMLDTLTYLQRGGRIGRAQALLGGVLHVKPVLRLTDGEAQPQARVRNARQGVDRLLELVAAEGPLEAAATMWSEGAELARLAHERLASAHPGVACSDGVLGPVVGVYAGPRAIGVACMRAPS